MKTRFNITNFLLFITILLQLTSISYNFLYQTNKKEPEIAPIIEKPPTIIGDGDYGMIFLINIERERLGLPLLVKNDQLTKSATLKACDMRDNGYFAHEDLQGRQSWHLFDEVGFISEPRGENLVKDIPNTKKAILALMQSKTHRDNILNEKYTDIGIGYCGKYTVQHFGKSGK